MSELPIKRYEYECSVLMVDFVGKVRDYFKNNPHISDVLFIPSKKGYKITYLLNGNNAKITISKNGIFNPRLSIRKYENDKFINSYLSKSTTENISVADKLLK